MCGGGGDGPTVPLWIVSFSDMVANLVTFFIVLATFNAANSKGDRIKIVPVESSPGSFGGKDQPPAPSFVTRTGDKSAVFGDRGPENPSRRNEQELDEKLNKLVQGSEYSVRPDLSRLENGAVRITLQEEGLFLPGSTNLKPSAAEVLEELGRFFRGEKCVMIVEAHTDAETWKLTDYESDVAVTRAMAANVAHALVTRCGVPAARVAIQPMGSARPVDREGTAAARRRNRRLEFVVGADP